MIRDNSFSTTNGERPGLLFTKLSFLPALLTRLVLAAIFISSGWMKFHNIAFVTNGFTNLGIPAAKFMTYLVATTEFGCGLLLLVGLLTRLASLPLIITMVVALLTAHQKHFIELGSYLKQTLLLRKGIATFATHVQPFLSLAAFQCLLLLIWLFVVGAGWLSIDRLFVKIMSRKKNSSTYKK